MPADLRRDLAHEMISVIDAHRELWGARNRPGGLDDSVSWLAHLRECYDTGETQRDWGSQYVG
jgi:hypothetical protein